MAGWLSICEDFKQYVWSSDRRQMAPEASLDGYIISFAALYSSSVQKHLTVHTGETHMCLHCGKGFADISSRNVHEKYQHSELEIACPECGKQFKHPKNLKLHMVHHNMDTPYDGKKRQYSNEVKLEALKLAKEIGATEAEFRRKRRKRRKFKK